MTPPPGQNPLSVRPSRRRVTVVCGAAWVAAMTLVCPAEWFRWQEASTAGASVARFLLTDWNLDSTPYFWLLLAAPLCALFRTRGAGNTGERAASEPATSRPETPPISRGRAAAAAALVTFAAWSSSAWIAARPTDMKSNVRFGSLPPAYHDEFSYLLQARTYLSGRWSLPGNSERPELFDQVHVLNEGAFASRYFPGTGAWMAPFVAAGHPYWAPRIAACLAALCLLAAGCELGGLRLGFLAGLLTALSPGIALFSNLLLAHLPTLVGLGVFLAAMLRFMRKPKWPWALTAGIGLSFAMLCRPMTAAGFALPFGVWMLVWATRSTGTSLRSRAGAVAAMGVPLVAGFALMAAQNQEVTGDWRTSPYQQYTEIYTPRHVFGFDNVVRGERRLGPKVLEEYDRWAENLTPALAVRNVFHRIVASGQWTLGLVPLLMSGVVFCGLTRHEDARWKWIGLSILSLHAVHVPYWFDGIMHWHYVFETAPLLLLLTAGATCTLLRAWRDEGRSMLSVWWLGLLMMALATAYVSGDFFVLFSLTAAAALATAAAASMGPPNRRPDRRLAAGLTVLAAAFGGAMWFSPAPLWPLARLDAAISEIGFSRMKYAAFRDRTRRAAHGRAALVLVVPDAADRHIDYVTNDDGLDARVLIGRYPKDGDVASVARAFPERAMLVFDAASGVLREYRRP